MYYARDVRQEVIHRMNVKDEYKYRKNCINLISDTLEDYKRLCKVFASGFTHAVHVNKVLHKVRSYDISSSFNNYMQLDSNVKERVTLREYVDSMLQEKIHRE